MARICINDQWIEVDKEIPISDLLASADVPPNYLAVEVNGEVVPREEHKRFIVKDGDCVEVVTLVGGG